ncbi:UNVERIFIED_CONTAM: hypothetical protein K2H54_001212 [Gekko kuhli]
MLWPTAPLAAPVEGLERPRRSWDQARGLRPTDRPSCHPLAVAERERLAPSSPCLEPTANKKISNGNTWQVRALWDIDHTGTGQDTQAAFHTAERQQE